MATVMPTAARPGRWAELFLTLFALALSFYAYAQVSLAITGKLPKEMWLYCGAFTGLALIVHLLERWRAPYADPFILPVVVALNGIGLAMIYRLSFYYKDNPGPSRPPNVAERQLLWTLIAVAGAMLVIIFLRDHRTLRRLSYTSMILGLVFLLLPLAPGIGIEINGSQIWIAIGGLTFQPAELSKVLLAVFFAGYLVTNRDALALAGPKLLGLQLPRLRDLGPIALAWAVSVGVLVFERDLGTSLLFFAMFVAMLYVATDRPSWIVIGLGFSVIGVVGAYKFFSHVQARFDGWLNAFDNDLYEKTPGGTYQLVQGLFGLGQGGLSGTGWGAGRPYLTPLAHSDFIATALGEEIGLTGLMAVLILYLILIERAMRTGIGVRDGFGKLLAVGLGFTLASQVFVVVGGVTRLIPLTGLTLPFLAAGGSSLVANWIIAAILLRISDGARRPPPNTSEIDLGPVIEAERKRAAQQDAQATQAVARP